MKKRFRRPGRRRKARTAKPAPGPASDAGHPAVVIAKAVIFDWLRYLTAPLWLPFVVIRTIRDRIGRTFRQAQVEGAAARRQARRMKRSAGDAADEQ